LKAGSQKPTGGAPLTKPVLPSPLPDQRSIRNLDSRPSRPTPTPTRPLEEPVAEVVLATPVEPPPEIPDEALEVPAAAIAPPPTLRPSKLPEKKEAVAKPIATLTREQLTGARPVRPEDLMRPKVEAPVVPIADDEDDDKKKGKGGKSAGGKAIPGREDRRRE